MKEVLIYGALVAAVLGVSTTLITNMTANLGDSANQVNTAIVDRVNDLLQVGQN